MNVPLSSKEPCVHVHVNLPSRQDARPQVPWRHTAQEPCPRCVSEPASQQHVQFRFYPRLLSTTPSMRNMAVTEMSFATAQWTSRLRVETPARALGLRAGPPKVCARQIVKSTPARRACRAGIRKGSGSLHSLESHFGVTSEFERVVRPRVRRLPAANGRSAAVLVCRPLAARPGWPQGGWRLSSNPEHRSIGDRFLMCEVAWGCSNVYSRIPHASYLRRNERTTTTRTLSMNAHTHVAHKSSSTRHEVSSSARVPRAAP